MKAVNFSTILRRYIGRICLSTITLMLLLSCQPQNHAIDLEFLPVFNGTQLDCHSSLLAGNQTWQISQLQFYLSSIKVKDANNQWLSAQLIHSENENNEIALVGGVCDHSFNWKVSLSSPLSSKQIKGVQFDLGVPFHLNHQNPLTQKSPLNQSDMFWTWQLGYKFLRLELASNNSEWIFHLGSTGCESPAPVRAPKAQCKNPNLSNILLKDYDSSKPIEINLSNLLQGAILEEENNCQSFPGSPLCEVLFPKVGIGGAQVIFSQLRE